MISMVITGGNRGLGFGMIKAVLNLPKDQVPKNIVALCRNPHEAKELTALADEHKNIHILPLEGKDFSKYDTVANKVSDIVKEDGLDLLINNAGVGSRFHRIGMVKPEELIDTFTVNTVAPIMLTKHMIPLLKIAADKKKPQVPKIQIVNISSILGSMGLNGDGGHYSYRCSKAALNAATVSMKVDLKGTGIAAVALHPGWVKTRMGGAKAPLEVDEACTRLVNTIMQLTDTHNGGFFDLDGKKLLF